MNRAKASVVLMLTIMGGCTRYPEDFKPMEIVGTSFSMEAKGITECATTAMPSVFRSRFFGEFVGDTEEIPETFVPKSGGKYILVRSNDLHREYYNSTDGWGGPKMASVGHHPVRKNVSGVLVEGEFKCGGNELSDPLGYRGFFFAVDYGQPE